MAELQGQLQLQRHLVLPAEWNIRKSHFFCELTSVCWFLRSLCSKCAVKAGRGSGTLSWAVSHCGIIAGIKIRFDGLAFIIYGVLAPQCRMAGCKQWFATALAENWEQCVKAGSFKCCWYPRRVSGCQLKLMRGWQNILGPCKAEVWK